MFNDFGFQLLAGFSLTFCAVGLLFGLRDHYFAKGYKEGYTKGLVTGRRANEQSDRY
jgi:hypothetical protein